MTSGGGRLAGKTCVVTGAAGGLGAEICRAICREGGAAIGLDLVRPPGSDLLQVDIRDERSVASAMQRIAEAHGGIDVLVNNAGVGGPRRPAHEVEVAEFDELFAVNVRGTWLCTKHVVPRMIAAGGGSIVNMSSMYGLVGNAMLPLYHATKGAVRLMTKADAATYAEHAIRVNSVHPGSIDTGSPGSVRQDESPTAREYNARTLAAIPLGARGEPADVAHGVLFLASDESKYVTGAELVIDGGYTAV
ncbi:SDR family oxidoreductase [Saccharopolyspora sp. TS4A08]|uniref:SDR family oxidoreductase n=1 Tax=Saccharopolyspora ipomoeae TaxID=3042027 RepID=A0ABT6PJQ1_9PSEU|nr:SDR family oxidoreductase [Saccharopolyspora sp. TS4A08]MDI2028225.1 SDR family oxidoreductase [Saccharopolyspora sp. TS4A08]